MFEIKDLAGLGEPLKRVIDCLDKGISSLMSPFVYKRMERAKMQIEQERSNQNALIAIKDAMTQDLIKVARTTRDRLELQNVASIYGGAMVELQNFDPSKLPVALPSSEWSAYFYDCAKDCSDDEIRILWSKILAGEIIEPGKYYKRTLTNLKQLEKHEAEWFVKLCKYSIENSYAPLFILDNENIYFNESQSLVDCGFIDANHGNLAIEKDEVVHLKTQSIYLCLKDMKVPYHMNVMTFTDTGIQICGLVNVETDKAFVQSLVEKINSSNVASATLL